MQQPQLSRRDIARATLASSLFVLGKQSAVARTPDATTVAGFVFKDDAGVTVQLDQLPSTIIAEIIAATALWDFGIRPNAVFGDYFTVDGQITGLVSNVDLDTVQVIGGPEASIEIEEAIALDPDLFISAMWAGGYWGIYDDMTLTTIQDTAPLIGIGRNPTFDAQIERYAELAAALGTDLNSPELTMAKESLAEAEKAFSDTISTKGDLTVMFLSAFADSVQLAVAKDWPRLEMFVERSMNLFIPEVDPENTSPWLPISHEEALNYPCDVIFQTTYGASLTIEELRNHPTWSLHPAVKAGQAFNWSQDIPFSYQGLTNELNRVADVLSHAEKVT